MKPVDLRLIIIAELHIFKRRNTDSLFQQFYNSGSFLPILCVGSETWSRTRGLWCFFLSSAFGGRWPAAQSRRRLGGRSWTRSWRRVPAPLYSTPYTQRTQHTNRMLSSFNQSSRLHIKLRFLSSAVRRVSYLVERVHGEQNHPGNIQGLNDLIGYRRFPRSTSPTQTYSRGTRHMSPATRGNSGSCRLNQPDMFNMTRGPKDNYRSARFHFPVTEAEQGLLVQSPSCRVQEEGKPSSVVET